MRQGGPTLCPQSRGPRAEAPGARDVHTVITGSRLLYFRDQRELNPQIVVILVGIDDPVTAP